MRLLNKILNKASVGKNILANQKAVPITTPALLKQADVEIVNLDLDKTEFLKWQRDYYPEGEKIFKTGMHKKMLELYVSFLLLDIKSSDVYMDAAGGQYSYASRINCAQKIIQDIRLSDKLKNFHGTGVTYLDSSCADIPLADKSVNKISCHHSIEHFQKNADSDFMNEVQRLLAPGGRCVILPVFICENSFLITDNESFSRWNETGEWLADTSATLPGGAGSGHFARVYSPATLKSRLLDRINPELFKYFLVSIKMNGEEIPNASLFMNSSQALMNNSYRALVIERM